LLLLFRGGGALGRVNDMANLAAHKRARRILLLLMAEHADRMTAAQTVAIFEDMAGCTTLPEILAGARHNGPIKPVADVNCRVRIAWGLNDRMLPFRRYGAPMLMAVPAAEFVFLPGVGHVPMIDDPALVANTILTFIKGVPL
jgi:pimeloyl-ACP methyl ester carboxylesterase